MQRKIIALLVIVFLVMVVFFFYKKLQQHEQRENAHSVIEQTQLKIVEQSIYDVTENQLLEGALKGMAQAINDPYSAYYTVKEAALQKQELAKERIGIGVELAQFDQKIVIVGTLKNSPAQQAGLLPYDELVQVNHLNVNEKTFAQVLVLLQGEENEAVSLTVYRPQQQRHFTYELKRQKLSNQTVSSRVISEAERKVGYIEITLFGEGTAMEWVTALKRIMDQNVHALIIDVRGNPGGYLQAAAQVISTFQQKERPFAYLQNAKGEIQQVMTKPLKEGQELTTFLNGIPVALLINGGSASAAEVVAASLKSWQLATLVGEKTFGKGTVQETWTLENKGELKLSTHKWLTPEQQWIHKVGIEPQIEQVGQLIDQLPSKIIVQPYELGDYAEDIAYVQQILFSLGYTIRRQDGYFDSSTAEAVEQFRENHQLIKHSEMDQVFYQELYKQLQDKKKNKKNDLQLQMAISYLIHQLAPGT